MAFKRTDTLSSRCLSQVCANQTWPYLYPVSRALNRSTLARSTHPDAFSTFFFFPTFMPTSLLILILADAIPDSQYSFGLTLPSCQLVHLHWFSLSLSLSPPWGKKNSFMTSHVSCLLSPLLSAASGTLCPSSSEGKRILLAQCHLFTLSPLASPVIFGRKISQLHMTLCSLGVGVQLPLFPHSAFPLCVLLAGGSIQH